MNKTLLKIKGLDPAERVSSLPLRNAFIVFLVVFFLLPKISMAFTYKWEDAQGNLHFTDDFTLVPPALREKAEILSLPERPSNAISPETAPSTGDGEPEDRVETYTECQETLHRDIDRWRQQLVEDQATLLDVNRQIHRIPTSRTKNQLQRERVLLKERIRQTKTMLEEELPARQSECAAKEYWLNE